MKISTNLIKQVVSDVAGEDVVPLVMAIRDKKNISEFKIAELITEPINNTRNKLYRLFDNNLINFVRKKDRKKGWYIYYWTFNEKQIKFLMLKLKKERLIRLNDRLHRETNDQFYACPNRCIRLDFEKSTSYDFKCPECGSLMEHEDNSKDVEKIKKEIIEVEAFLKEEYKELGLLPRKAVIEKKEKAIAKPAKEKIKKTAPKKTVKKAVKTATGKKKLIAKKPMLKKKVMPKKIVKKKKK